MPLIVPGLSTSSSTTPTPTSSSPQDSVFDECRFTENPVSDRSGSTSEELRGNLQHKPTETEKYQNEGREEEQSDLLHDLPDWLQEFREIFVDESSLSESWSNPAPKDRDTASSSHELQSFLSLYGHRLAGLLWERQFENALLEHGWEQIKTGNVYLSTEQKGLFLSVNVERIWILGVQIDLVIQPIQINSVGP